MPFDETTSLDAEPAPLNLTFGGDAAPSISETFGAALRTENIIGSAFSSERAWLGGSDSIDPTFNVFDHLGDEYTPHMRRFENVFSEPAMKAVMADIDRETRDRRILAASGWTGVAATLGANVLDPTILLPGGALVRSGRAGYAAARSALNVGAAAGAATAVQEVGLQATQELRTAGETAFSIGGGVLLGGALGAGVSALMTRAEFRAAAKAIDAARGPEFDAATDVLHRELATLAGQPQPAGAAATTRASLDDLSIAGRAASKVAAATASLNPLLRTLTSPSRTVREVSSQLMENPVYLKRNLEGEGDAAAETVMHIATRGAVTRAMEAQEAAYLNARKAGLEITKHEFREAVGLAMRRGDESSIPGVSEAAKAWRSHVIEPLRKQAVQAGLLSEDARVTTAPSYFHRMWRKPVLEAREHEFKRITAAWLSDQIDGAAAGAARRQEKRIRALETEREEIALGIERRNEATRRRIEDGEISTDELDEASIVDLVRRLNAGEKPPKAPERLSQWIRRQGRVGIYDPGGELAAIDPAFRKVPGLLRKSRKGTANPKGGDTLDDFVQRAWEEGFLGAPPARMADGEGVQSPTLADFLDALDKDVRGGARVVRVADEDAARIADDFDNTLAALDRAGVDVKAPRFGTSEDLKDIASRVNKVLSDLDKERIAGIEARMARAGKRGDLEFLSDADRQGYIDGIVDDIFAKLTGKDLVGGDLPAGFVLATRGPLKARTFSIPDRLVEDFLEHDAEMVGRRYARIMSADIELTKRFGSADMKAPLESIRTEYDDLRAAVEKNADLSPAAKEKALRALGRRQSADTRDVEAVRDLLRGEYRPEIQNTGWARISAAANTFNYVRALGGVVISSLTDAVRPAMVHGLRAYMEDGIGPLVRNMKAVKMSRQEAKLAGAVAERMLASRIATMAEITDPYSMASPFERFLQNVSSGFSKATGLLHWNDFHKNIASVMTQNRVLKNAELAAAKGFNALPARERAYMGYLGIGQDRAENLGRLFAQHGETLDGVRVANTEAWGDEPLADYLRRAYRAAVNKDVDSIIVTKSVGDVPLLANTPLGRTLLQFKSFALASNQRVLIRGLQEDQTRFVGGVVGMATIGAFVYALKQLEAGREISDNPGTWAVEGLDRSGIFSIAFEVNNALGKLGAPDAYTLAAAAFPDADQRQPASRFAVRNFASTLAGPTAGTVQDASQLASLGLRNLSGAFDGDGLEVRPGDIGAARRLTPFASLPYWRWAIDGFLVPELKEGVR